MEISAGKQNKSSKTEWIHDATKAKRDVVERDSMPKPPGVLVQILFPKIGLHSHNPE